MQFYIIHDDPTTNANLLPEYAIRKVNAREGMQILSDIAHLFGITFEGQSKPYSIWHAETRRFWKSKEDFRSFISHYTACVLKYNELTNKTSSWFNKLSRFLTDLKHIEIEEAIEKAGIVDEYTQIRHKLVNQKKQHLTQEEIDELQLV